MTTILRHDEIDVNNITYFSQQKYGNIIFVPIGYKYNTGKIPLIFQIPSIKLNDMYKHNNMIVPINCLNKFKTPSLKELLNNIDDRLINDFKSYAHVWFRDFETNIKNLDYKSIVNDISSSTDNDDIYSNGVFGLKLIDEYATLIKKQPTHAKIYDIDKNIKNEIDYNKFLVSGTIVQSIIELKGILINITDTNNEIIPYIKVHQIRFIEEEKLNDINLDMYSFLDSEIEPKNMQKKLTGGETKKKLEKVVSENVSDNNSESDNSDNDDNDVSDVSDNEVDTDCSDTSDDCSDTDNIAVKFFKKNH